MINRRRQTKESREIEECCSCRPVWRLTRKTSVTALMVVLIICIAAGPTVAQLSTENRVRGYGATENTNEDLQVIFTGPMMPLPSWSSDVTPSISLYEQELARCKLSKSKMFLSLVRQGTWSEVNERKVSKALTQLSKFFAIPKEFFHLDDVSLDDLTTSGLYHMLWNSARPGPGPIKLIGRRFSRLSFVVGCNNEMFPTGKLIASQIVEQMNEGLIAEITDINFDDHWVWTHRFLNNRMNRRKRDTAIEGSGEDEEDTYVDYDGEGDDEEPDGITEVPTVTYESHAHRHHHGNSNNKDNDSATPTSVNADDDDDYYDEEFEDTATTAATTPPTVGARLVPVVEISTVAATTERLPTTTEVVEPEIVNSPPVIKSRIPKQPLTAGKPFSFTIPLETFFDAEDGTNLKLTLLDKNDQPLKSNSWIQFDENKREVYGLPLEEVVSRWQYKLHATDKGGESVVETLDLTVQQHKSHRSANHEISIVLKLIAKFNNSVDWQLQLIRGIIDLVSDSDMSNIVVREIRPSAQEPAAMTFVFTNDSLPKDKCPEDELPELLKRYEPTSLNAILAPEIAVVSITGQQIGNCQKTNVVKPKPTPSIAKNYPPVARNQVDRVSAVVGSLLVFQVPLDTFYDPEDKSDLKLSLLTMDRKKLDSRNWLQFDSKNREFYGIPLLMDVGQKEYVLVAEDSEGLAASDALVVTVTHPKPQRDHNAVIQLHLNATVDSVNSPLFQRRFVERLAQVFGDADTSNIKVRALPQQYNRGQQSTFSYYNASIYRVHNQQCPDDEIDKLKTVLLERDGSLRDSVKITFGSEFRVLKAQFVPAGTCQAADNSIYDPIKPIRTSEKQVPTTTKDDYLMTFILPAAIILTMLLLGSIIACVLHRRRMTGKMELGDEEERRSFRSKGIPVIFHDELDEKPEIVTKSPIILKDEKPPLLPPSYNSTAIDGDSEDVDEYVPPPAVMMGNRESRGKSPVTPSYRKPPPYVSP